MSIEDLAEMDDYDCGKQYLCELSAMEAGQHNIQDPLLISLLQVSVSLLLFLYHSLKSYYSSTYCSNSLTVAIVGRGITIEVDDCFEQSLCVLSTMQAS